MLVKQNNLILPIGLIIMMIASIVVLAIMGHLQNLPDWHKSWTAVYFTNPNDFKLERNLPVKFEIKNFEGKVVTYNYKILLNSDLFKKDSLTINPSNIKSVDLVLNLPYNTLPDSAKLSVSISYEGQNKKIYKYLFKN